MPSTDDELLRQIYALATAVNSDNVGDAYAQAVALQQQIKGASNVHRAEQLIAQIRAIARDAEIGWKVFTVPPTAPRPLTEDEQLQLVTLIATLHTFCYGAERIDEASAATWPGSTPVRFYINSLYHYIAALYLLERGGDPIGGMVFKALAPMGLSALLDPVKAVLEKPMEGGVNFGETIRQLRNGFLVHGTFSPDDVASVVNTTKLRNTTQVMRLTSLIWELFNQSFILELQLIALLSASGTDIEKLVKNHVAKASKP
jgi:hypothetical protein